ncbi:MAG: hypothetical protein HYS62_02065 [Candidatus Aenigmarchaeota archaeon]|nr:hypothetical protein [Candidatus Aenigmarchaeota archaeon]
MYNNKHQPIVPGQEVLAIITRDRKSPYVAETLDGRTRLNIRHDGSDIPNGCLVSVRITRAVVGHTGRTYGDGELTQPYGIIDTFKY